MKVKKATSTDVLSKSVLRSSTQHLTMTVKSYKKDFKLVGGVAVVKLVLLLKLVREKARVEDALNSTRAAVEDGIVCGGGTALIRVKHVLDNIETSNSEQAFGVSIVRRAIEEPLRQISYNAGVEAAVVVDRVAAEKEGFGFNALELMKTFTKLVLLTQLIC